MNVVSQHAKPKTGRDKISYDFAENFHFLRGIMDRRDGCMPTSSLEPDSHRKSKWRKKRDEGEEVEGEERRERPYVYLGEDAIHGSRRVLLEQAGQSCLHQCKIYHILCVGGDIFRTPY